MKYTFEELRETQDKLNELIGGNNEAILKESYEWYEAYDDKVNRAIYNARTYIKYIEEAVRNEIPVKLEKIKLPEFDSNTKKYLKWKETFVRYTKSLNDDVKYDYLLNCTKGKSNEMVSNKSTYRYAIASLDKEFGNRSVSAD